MAPRKGEKRGPYKKSKIVMEMENFDNQSVYYPTNIGLNLLNLVENAVGNVSDQSNMNSTESYVGSPLAQESFDPNGFLPNSMIVPSYGTVDTPFHFPLMNYYPAATMPTIQPITNAKATKVSNLKEDTKMENSKEKPKAEYSLEMIESLLQFRCVSMKSCFSGTKSKTQLTIAWNKLKIRFNAHMKTEMDVTQLKNKYNSLKKEFTKITMEEKDTGNRTNEPIVKPAYWDSLCFYFGDLKGAGSKDYGQSSSLPSSVNSDGEDQESDSLPVDQKRKTTQEIIRNQREARKPRKVEIGESVVQMAKILSDGLIRSSGASTNHHAEENKEINQTLKEIQQQMTELNATNRQTNEINLQLLEFLKSKK